MNSSRKRSGTGGSDACGFHPHSGRRASSQSLQSLQSLLGSESAQRSRLRHGVDISRLQEWRNEHRLQKMNEEECKQELALIRMKKEVNANTMVVRIQSWARMLKCRAQFLVVLREKSDFKWLFLRGWYVYARAEFLYRRSILLRPLREWALEASESRRLSELALTIFKKAVNSSKLTPQAVMAFFSSDAWQGKITERELNSVRRLILKTLFAAWIQEAKQLRIRRFKASQIITRMLRRTFGNLSQKERLILTLHVWHRLAAVSSAERRGDPQPNFSQPYIKEWPMILQNITVKKIKKIRAQESSRQLIKVRSFKAWCKALANDNAPDNENSQAMAESHFVEHLLKTVFDAWNGLARERGRNLRRREKCFTAWKQWAPLHRRLRGTAKIVSNWEKHQKQSIHFGMWASSMHGIVASRTHSLRTLRQKIFDTKVLTVCYTMLDQRPHLMLLDCWRRWKLYWKKRRNWLRARWRFRTTWMLERTASLFQAWVEYVKEVKLKRNAKPAEEVENASSQRRRGIIRRATSKNLIDNSEKEMTQEEYEKTFGFANKSFLSKCFAVMNDGVESKLEIMPNRLEFITLLRAFWERPPPIKASSENPTSSNVLTSNASTCSTEASAETVVIEQKDRRVDENSEVYLGLSAVDIAKVAKCIVEKHEVLPEHIERFCIGLGDKFVPLISLLLTKSTAYIAKRVLLGDLKEQVMRCNSPLTAMLIGTHVSRWDALQLTTREVKSLTDDSVLQPKAGSQFQIVFIMRCLTLLMIKHRCRDLINACAIDSTKKAYTEEEDVALVLRRQKLEKLWRTEEVMRGLLGVPLDPIAESEKEELKASYADFYVGKAKKHTPKPKEKAVDPWIFNMDLGSLLREYALLTGSLAEAARDMRQPLLKRDRALLKNGLLRQARLDYQALKEYTSSLRPQVKKKKLGVRPPRKKKKVKKKERLYDEEDMEEVQERENADEDLMDMDQNGGANGDNGEFLYDSSESVGESFGGGSSGVIDGEDEEDKEEDDDDENGMTEEDSEVQESLSRSEDDDTQQPPDDSDGPVEKSSSALWKHYMPNADSGPDMQSIAVPSAVYELQPHVMIENWWPTLPKPVQELPPNRSVKYSESAKAILNGQSMRNQANECIISRQIASSRNCVARLVTTLEQLGLPSLAVRQVSDYCQDKSGIIVLKSTQQRVYNPPLSMVNIGANFVELIHNKPYRLMQLKQWKAWWPRKWWQHERLSQAIEEEIVKIEDITNKTQTRLAEVQVKYKEIGKEVSDYNKYMSQMRRKMIAIGGKTKEYDKDSSIQRSALKRLLDTCKITVNKKEKALCDQKALVEKAKVKLEEKKFEDVCSILMETRNNNIENEKVKQDLEKLNEIHEDDEDPHDEEEKQERHLAYRGVAKQLIQNHEELTIELTEDLQMQEAKLKRLETEFESFCTQNKSVVEMLSHVAKEKFSCTLDVQDLAEKRMATLKTLKKEEEEHKRVMKFLNRYGEELMNYSDHLVSVKEKPTSARSTPSPTAAKPFIGKLGKSSTGLTPTHSPGRMVVGKQQSLVTDDEGHVQVSPPPTADHEHTSTSFNAFSPPAPRGHTPLKEKAKFTHSDTLESVADVVDMSLPENINKKTLDYLESKKGRKQKQRMSLVDFSRIVSEEDGFSLKSMGSDKKPALAADFSFAEKGGKISDELARSIRVEITDEYWNILEMMESQDEKHVDPAVFGEEESSVTSSQASLRESHSNLEDLMFFDEEDLENFPQLNRKLSRTARMYNRVKARCLMDDTDKTSSWPEIIEEELQMELAAALKEEEEAKAANMHPSRRRDVMYDINRRKGTIKRKLKQHKEKENAEKEHANIDPYSGNVKHIDSDNLLPDPLGEGIEKCDESQWMTTDTFKQASISMAVHDPTNHPIAGVAVGDGAEDSKSRSLQEEQSFSMKNVRQRAAGRKRRKAVVKVVLMDPFASAGCKINDRMIFNSKKNVVKPLPEDSSDKFALLQPEQVEWRRKMSGINYELKGVEEPRRTARDEKITRRQRSMEEPNAATNAIDTIAEEASSSDPVEKGDEQSSQRGSVSVSLSASDVDGSVAVDCDGLFAKGLIDEEEYDRLKLLRAEEERKRIQEEKEAAAAREAERKFKRATRNAKGTDTQQSQTATAAINAVSRGKGVETYTIYDDDVQSEDSSSDSSNDSSSDNEEERKEEATNEEAAPCDQKLDESTSQQKQRQAPRETSFNLEKTNFWGGGVDLGVGPQMHSDDDSLLSRPSTKDGSASVGTKLENAQQHAIPEHMDDEAIDESKEPGSTAKLDKSTDVDVDATVNTAPAPIDDEAHVGKETTQLVSSGDKQKAETESPDEEAPDALKGIDRKKDPPRDSSSAVGVLQKPAPKLSLRTNFSEEALRTSQSSKQVEVKDDDDDKVESQLSPDDSVKSALSDLSHVSAPKDNEEANNPLTDDDDDDDHSVLSISSKSKQQCQLDHATQVEVREGQAMPQANGEWTVVPCKRAVLSPDTKFRSKAATGEAIFGRKIAPSQDSKALKKDRAVRARIRTELQSKSPSPSRRPLPHEDPSGVMTFEAVPVQNVHVKTVSQNAGYPLELRSESNERPTTASDKNARPVIYNPKRWKNKFFNGKELMDSVEKPIEEPNQNDDASDARSEEVQRRKPPVLSSVRRPPSSQREKTLEEFVTSSMQEGNDSKEVDHHVDHHDDRVDHDDPSMSTSSSPVGIQRKRLSFSPSVLTAYSSGISEDSTPAHCPPAKKEVADASFRDSLDFESYGMNESQAFGALLEDQEHQEHPDTNHTPKSPMHDEIGPSRVEKCVENVVRILHEDNNSKSPGSATTNATHRYTRTKDFNRGQGNRQLKVTAERRRAGLIPPSFKETCPVRGEYSEDLPVNGSIEGQSVSTVFATLHNSSSPLMDKSLEELSDDVEEHVTSSEPNEGLKHDERKPIKGKSKQLENIKTKFEKLQSRSRLASESSPQLDLSSLVRPEVIPLAPDAIGRQKLKRSQAMQRNKAKHLLNCQSTDSLNLQNLDFPYLSNDLMTSTFHRGVSWNTRSAPQLPPISNPSSRGAQELASQILESKEETQRKSPVGKGRLFAEDSLYVRYTPSSHDNNKPPPFSPPERVMAPPLLSGSYADDKEKSKSSSSFNPQNNETHNSDDIVLAAYAAASGLPWSSQEGSGVTSTDREALQDLLASIEMSRSRAPMFSQEEFPLGTLVPPGGLQEGSGPVVSAPTRDPLDPNASAHVMVCMSSEDSADHQSVMSVSIKSKPSRDKLDDEEVPVELDDEEAMLEAELRAHLEAQKSTAPMNTTQKRSQKGKIHIGNKSKKKSARAEASGRKLPSLVVGASSVTPLPKQKPTRRGKGSQSLELEGDSSVLSLNSVDSLSASSYKQAGKSASSRLLEADRLESQGESHRAHDSTAAALLEKYAPRNNPRLAAHLSKKNKQSNLYQSKKLSTFDSNGADFDPPALLQRTMTDTFQ